MHHEASRDTRISHFYHLWKISHHNTLMTRTLLVFNTFSVVNQNHRYLLPLKLFYFTLDILSISLGGIPDPVITLMLSGQGWGCAAFQAHLLVGCTGAEVRVDLGKAILHDLK